MWFTSCSCWNEVLYFNWRRTQDRKNIAQIVEERTEKRIYYCEPLNCQPMFQEASMTSRNCWCLARHPNHGTNVLLLKAPQGTHSHLFAEIHQHVHGSMAGQHIGHICPTVGGDDHCENSCCCTQLT